jgi:hypothetical protein
MQQLVAGRGVPDLVHAGGIQAGFQGVGAEGPEHHTGGPKDARPCECDAVVHAPDRCKFPPGTKDQNEG